MFQHLDFSGLAGGTGPSAESRRVGYSIYEETRTGWDTWIEPYDEELLVKNIVPNSVQPTGSCMEQVEACLAAKKKQEDEAKRTCARRIEAWLQKEEAARLKRGNSRKKKKKNR